MALSTVCNHCHHPSPELSHRPQLKVCVHHAAFCLCEFDYARFLMWNRTIFFLPRLAYFTQHGVFTNRVCCGDARISFLRLSNILYLYTPHLVFIHWFVVGHSNIASTFWLLQVNAVIVGVQISRSLLSILWGCMPRSRILLDHVVILRFIFWGPGLLFSIVPAPFMILPVVYQGASFSSARQHLLFCFVDSSHPAGYEVVHPLFSQVDKLLKAASSNRTGEC